MLLGLSAVGQFHENVLKIAGHEFTALVFAESVPVEYSVTNVGESDGRFLDKFETTRDEISRAAYRVLCPPR